MIKKNNIYNNFLKILAIIFIENFYIGLNWVINLKFI